MKLLEDKDLRIVKKNIESYPHQPKKAYALTLEEIATQVSYNSFLHILHK